MNSITVENNEIKEEVLKKVEVGQSINYAEFLKLYEPYKDIISELDFARILGISYSNYMSIKSRNRRAKVFKKKYKNISEEEKEQIKNEILKKVVVGQSISYIEFLELYNPYKNIISEVDFTGILGISYRSYIDIKHKVKEQKY